MARRLTRAIGCDPAGAVNQGEIGLLLREHRPEIAERREDGQPDAPAVPVPGPVQRDLPDDVRRGHVGGEFTIHRLGDDQAEIVGQAVVEPTAPMRGGVGVTESGLHPDL